MKKYIKLLIAIPLFALNACAQKKMQNTEKTEEPIAVGTNSIITSSKNPYAKLTSTDAKKLLLTNAEWKSILPKNLYEVAREANTERAFTGKMWSSETKGTYYCAACGYLLFQSNQKFVSTCGWPSFFEQENKQSIVFKADNSIGMERTEALCGRCDSHLGHLFDDGPPPTNKRYCMNAVSLQFVPEAQKVQVSNIDTLVIGGGCFWCVEAVYESLDGVQSVTSGYAGGNKINPSYNEVSSGSTGAAEVVQIVYNNTKTNIDEILKVFFTVHDPTTLNRQGADAGTQYRSVIFYKNEAQKNTATTLINELTTQKVYDNKIVTTLEPLTKFYDAEKYHQDYYKKNSDEPYCKMVIQPKLDKFEKIFKDRLKKN